MLPLKKSQEKREEWFAKVKLAFVENSLFFKLHVSVTQSEVNEHFAILIPVFDDFGKGMLRLGQTPDRRQFHQNRGRTAADGA